MIKTVFSDGLHNNFNVQLIVMYVTILSYRNCNAGLKILNSNLIYIRGFFSTKLY